MLIAVSPMPASLSHLTSNTAHRKKVITPARAREQIIEKSTVKNQAPAKVITRPIKVKPIPTTIASLWFSFFWRRSISFSNQSRPCCLYSSKVQLAGFAGFFGFLLNCNDQMPRDSDYRKPRSTETMGRMGSKGKVQLSSNNIFYT